jgi:hypothetical protein
MLNYECLRISLELVGALLFDSTGVKTRGYKPREGANVFSKNLSNVLLVGLLALAGCQSSGGRPVIHFTGGQSERISAAEIDRDVDAELKKLYASTPAARELARLAVVCFQAGGQSFSYALFFMSNEALRLLHQSGCWEIGVGPSAVAVDGEPPRR